MTTPLITASWIDDVGDRDRVDWNHKTIECTEVDWRRPVRHLIHELGLKKLNLQPSVRQSNDVADEALAVYPSKHMRCRPLACADPPRVLAEPCPSQDIIRSGTSDEDFDWNRRITADLPDRCAEQPARPSISPEVALGTHAGSPA